MPEAVLAALVALIGGVLGWAVAWGSLKEKVKVATERAGTAIDQAQDAMARTAALSERQTRATGERRVIEERISGLRSEVNILRRISHDLPDPEPVRDESVPPIPPQRARQASRRDT